MDRGLLPGSWQGTKAHGGRDSTSAAAGQCKIMRMLAAAIPPAEIYSCLKLPNSASLLSCQSQSRPANLWTLNEIHLLQKDRTHLADDGGHKIANYVCRRSGHRPERPSARPSRLSLPMALLTYAQPRGSVHAASRLLAYMYHPVQDVHMAAANLEAECHL